MSNLYELRHGSLTMSSVRMFPTTPLVKLGDANFSKVRFKTLYFLMELNCSIEVEFLFYHVEKSLVIICGFYYNVLDKRFGTLCTMYTTEDSAQSTETFVNN